MASVAVLWGGMRTIGKSSTSPWEYASPPVLTSDSVLLTRFLREIATFYCTSPLR